MKHLIIILNIAFSFVLNAQSVTIRLIDAENRPIILGVAKVNLQLANYTDSNGLVHLANLKPSDKVVFSKLGYKQRGFLGGDLTNNTVVKLDDSIISLNEVKIKPLKFIKVNTGVTASLNQPEINYMFLHEGYLIDKIVFEKASFYIDELNFYVSGIDLPKSERIMNVKIHNCNLDSSEGLSKYTLFAMPVNVELKPKRKRYKIKFNQKEQFLITDSCLCVRFEIMMPSENYNLNSTRLIGKQYVVFPLYNQKSNVNTFVLFKNQSEVSKNNNISNYKFDQLGGTHYINVVLKKVIN